MSGKFHLSFRYVICLLLFFVCTSGSSAPVPVKSQCNTLHRLHEQVLCQSILQQLQIPEDQVLVTPDLEDLDGHYVTQGKAGIIVRPGHPSQSQRMMLIHVKGVPSDEPIMVKISYQESIAGPSETLTTSETSDELTLLELKGSSYQARTLIFIFSESSRIRRNDLGSDSSSGNILFHHRTSHPLNETFTTDYRNAGYVMAGLMPVLGLALWTLHAYDYYYAARSPLIGCISVSSYLLSYTLTLWLEIAVYQIQKCRGAQLGPIAGF